MKHVFKIPSLWKVFSIIALTGLLFFSAGTSKSFAENYNLGMGFGEIRGFFRGLSLTDDQKTQIRTIFTAHKTAITTDKAALKSANSGLLTYLRGGGSDTTQIGILTTAISTAVATLETEDASIFVEIYALLTDAQKQTLAQRNSHSGKSKNKD